jgi:hypothetical protein
MIMFSGATVGLLRLERSSLWQMFTPFARMRLSKGCGFLSLRGCNLWGEAGFVFVVILMLLNTLMSGVLSGWDPGPWITFRLAGSSRKTIWWIFPYMAASLLGTKGMTSR